MRQVREYHFPEELAHGHAAHAGRGRHGREDEELGGHPEEDAGAHALPPVGAEGS